MRRPIEAYETQSAANRKLPVVDFGAGRRGQRLRRQVAVSAVVNVSPAVNRCVSVFRSTGHTRILSRSGCRGAGLRAHVSPGTHMPVVNLRQCRLDAASHEGNRGEKQRQRTATGGGPGEGHEWTVTGNSHPGNKSEA